MAGAVGVLIVHGMGAQEAGFADPLCEGLEREIRTLGENPSRLSWKQALWARDLESKERALWDSLALKGLRWDKLRRFVVSALGDALAYQVASRGYTSMYASVHKTIHRCLRELRQDLGNTDKPLVVVAHSLGGQVMSNFIWDAQQSGYPGANLAEWSPFERMETLVTFVTFGCNIPLFTLAYEPVKSIYFPPLELPDRLRKAAKWLNFYDVDDVLGYPLKGLSASYNSAVTADIPIDVGRAWSAWSPVAHSGYWTDRDFTRPVAQAIVDVLRLV